MALGRIHFEQLIDTQHNKRTIKLITKIDRAITILFNMRIGGEVKKKNSKLMPSEYLVSMRKEVNNYLQIHPLFGNISEKKEKKIEIEKKK